MKKWMYGVSALVFFFFLSSCNMVNSDTLLYTVSFDLQGGVATESTYHKVQKDEELALFIPRKEGYQFEGWKYKEKVITENKVVITENTNFIATWRPCIYTVSFDLQGAELPDSSSKQIEYDSDYILPTPKLRGYTFLGWKYETETQTIQVEVSGKWNLAKDVTLEPLWEANVYTLILHPNEGILESENFTFSYGEKVELPIPVREGYTFIGWYREDDLWEKNVWDEVEDIELEAKWEKKATILGEFQITLLNQQNAAYDVISLYSYGTKVEASLYWYKIGIQQMKDKEYKIVGIAKGGETLQTLGEYDYVMLAYQNYPRYNEFITLPIEVGSRVTFSKDLFTLSKGEVDIQATFYDKPDITDNVMKEMQQTLQTLYGEVSVVSEDLDLLTEYQSYVISWKSSNKDVIDTSGKYQKPYVTRSVTLTAYYNEQEIYSFYFDVIGKEQESQALVTGYIYTGFDRLTDETMQTLDIIYCAFGEVNSQAEFQNMSLGSNFIKNLQTYVFPKAKQYGTKVILSVNEYSSEIGKSFGAIAGEEMKRKRLATNIVNMINLYGFDGVDIDWEYPASHETQNFTLLMKEIYTAVKANNQEHLVTAAIGGGMWQPPRYDLLHSAMYIDYINLMTYGMTTSNGQYQNALYKSPHGYTLKSCSIEESIAIYDQYEVPRSKILLGLAFYGMRQYDSSGVGTSSSKSSSISYANLVTTYLNQPKEGVLYCYDEDSEVPYIYDSVNRIFISYEDERSIARKCEYANTIGLAGVMYWQDGHDSGDILLKAIANHIHK